MYLTIHQFIYQIICYSDKGDATTADFPFVGFWNSILDLSIDLFYEYCH